MDHSTRKLFCLFICRLFYLWTILLVDCPACCFSYGLFCLACWADPFVGILLAGDSARLQGVLLPDQPVCRLFCWQSAFCSRSLHSQAVLSVGSVVLLAGWSFDGASYSQVVLLADCSSIVGHSACRRLSCLQVVLLWNDPLMT